MIYTKQWSSSHPDRVCWRAKVGYNITALYSCSYATTVLYSETRKAVFQHGQGKNHWHLLGIYNTNLYLWNTGEVQKNPEKVKFMSVLDHPHFTAALFLLQLSIHLYPGQTRLSLCSFQHQNESATLLGKQQKVQCCCVSRKEKKKGIFSDMCSGSWPY